VAPNDAALASALAASGLFREDLGAGVAAPSQKRPARPPHRYASVKIREGVPGS
jgi:hypothetical protein